MQARTMNILNRPVTSLEFTRGEGSARELEPIAGQSILATSTSRTFHSITAGGQHFGTGNGTKPFVDLPKVPR